MRTPNTSQPLAIPVRTTARMAAFIPGASPPLVKTAIFLEAIEGNRIPRDRGPGSRRVTRPRVFGAPFPARPAPGRLGREEVSRSGRSGLRCPRGGHKKKPAPTEINYITPAGFKRLADELTFLRSKKRPEVVGALGDAAAEGDRSENAEYIYRKKQLREIDRRLRFLSKRLDDVQIVDPATQPRRDRVFFGATVTVEDEEGEQGDLPDRRRRRDRRRRGRHLLEVAGRARAARQGQGRDRHRPLARRPARADHRQDRLPLTVWPRGSGVRDELERPIRDDGRRGARRSRADPSVNTRNTFRRSATAATLPSTRPRPRLLNLASSSRARATSVGSGASILDRVPGLKISAHELAHRRPILSKEVVDLRQDESGDDDGTRGGQRLLVVWKGRLPLLRGGQRSEEASRVRHQGGLTSRVSTKSSDSSPSLASVDSNSRVDGGRRPA